MPTRTPIAGLPIQKEWTVKAVREGAVEDNPNGGELQKFYVDFEGAPDVYWRRKLPATVEVGKTYYGTVSEGNFGPMFKKESPQGASGGGAGTTRSSGGNAGWKPESQYDPEKTARIGRAHAQEMAVRTCAAMGTFEGKSAEQLHSKLKGWIDWFEADVNATGQKAAQPTAAPAEEAAPPPAQAQGEDTEYLLKLCEDTGLSSYPAGKLAGFISSRLNPDQQTRARKGLENFETQGEVLIQLKKAYEEAEGEPLPPSDPGEDDIPF